VSGLTQPLPLLELGPIEPVTTLHLCYRLTPAPGFQARRDTWPPLPRR
jgi:hypothetical protein